MLPTLVSAAGLGRLVGSFLNVVVRRVPRGESVVSPPSACPGCGAPIAPRDNVPLLSWLLLRGRARCCGARISARYPMVELGTAVAFGAVTAWWWLGSLSGWAVPAFCYLAAISIALALIDVEVHRLPDAIVLPSYPIALVLLAIPTVADREWDRRLVPTLVGGLALWLFYFVLVLIYPAGMGFGDVKLAGVLGLYLGWRGWSPASPCCRTGLSCWRGPGWPSRWRTRSPSGTCERRGCSPNGRKAGPDRGHPLKQAAGRSDHRLQGEIHAP